MQNQELGIDITVPGKDLGRGHEHPLSIVMNSMTKIFSDLGFTISSGPEIEDEYHNFDALNVPKDHPARDMWDTFWMKESPAGENQKSRLGVRSGKHLLRTHTSPVQVRYMQTHTPPLRVLVPGKVFRYEATDATHEAQFYQCEGLFVGENISLASLKAVLATFMTQFFGKEVPLRLRPSFFPFTEPSVEIDIGCVHCAQSGCGVCKGTGWIEVMGAGMVHPSVLEAGGINPNIYRGFAFGVGVDRFAMLKYGIPDVRMFYTGDLRLIDQF